MGYHKMKSSAQRRSFKILTSCGPGLQLNETDSPHTVQSALVSSLQNPADLILLFPATSWCKRTGEKTTTASIPSCSMMTYFNFIKLLFIKRAASIEFTNFVASRRLHDGVKGTLEFRPNVCGQVRLFSHRTAKMPRQYKTGGQKNRQDLKTLADKWTAGSYPLKPLNKFT